MQNMPQLRVFCRSVLSISLCSIYLLFNTYTRIYQFLIYIIYFLGCFKKIVICERKLIQQSICIICRVSNMNILILHIVLYLFTVLRLSFNTIYLFFYKISLDSYNIFFNTMQLGHDYFGSTFKKDLKDLHFVNLPILQKQERNFVSQTKYGDIRTEGPSFRYRLISTSVEDVLNNRCGS